jgi:hypothetical protein
MERIIRLFAGSVLLISLGLAYWIHPYWLILTILVGINLLQSGFTDWCPMMWVLNKLNIKKTGTGKTEMMARGISGGLVLVSMLLVIFIRGYWGWLSVIVALNLIQFYFTSRCPIVFILKRSGIQ